MKCFDAPQPLHVASQRSNPFSSKFLSMYLAERFPLFWEEDANLSQPVIPLIALPCPMFLMLWDGRLGSVGVGVCSDVLSTPMPALLVSGAAPCCSLDAPSR